MRQIRVYVDTSVFGGTQDEEFREQSLAVLRQAERGRYLLLISAVTLAELSRSGRGTADIPCAARQLFSSGPR